MSALSQFLDALFHHGHMHVAAPLPWPRTTDEESVQVLRQAHEVASLDLAGPPLPFEPKLALAAAAVLHDAAYCLLRHELLAQEVQQRLALPGPATTTNQYWAVDLTLRYLPAIHRRARAHDPADVLTETLANLLRQWPLSGVLSAVEEPPAFPPDFGGHPGMCWLYAERLAAGNRLTWLPGGKALEYVEVVWRDLGKDAAVLERALHLKPTPGGLCETMEKNQ